MSRKVDFRENLEGISCITEAAAVVTAALMIMVAVVLAVTSVVRRWDSHVKRSFFPA